MSAKKIVYIQYANPLAYPPLLHSAELYNQKGFDVLFLGIYVHKKMCFNPVRNERQKFFFLTEKRKGFFALTAYLSFLVQCLFKVLREKPSVIYTSDIFSAPVACLAKHLTRAKIVYHEHDFIPIEHINSVFRAWLKHSHQKLIRRADVVVYPYAERFLKVWNLPEASKHFIEVYNCPLKKEVAVKTNDEVERDSKLKLVYHGTITPRRLSKNIIKAMSLFKGKMSLKIVGYEVVGTEGYSEELRQLAEQNGVSVEIPTFTTYPIHHEVLIHSRGADLGLALQDELSGSLNDNYLVFASNKVFDYLALGIPALVPCSENWRKAIVEPGFGKSADAVSLESIAQAFEWALHNREALARMGQLGQNKILKDWNYETQFEPVLKLTI